MTVFLIGTMATGSERPNPLGEVTLEALINPFNTMNRKLNTIDVRIINMEGRLNSTNSTPHNNLQDLSSGHTQDTSHTITSRTFQ